MTGVGGGRGGKVRLTDASVCSYCTITSSCDALLAAYLGTVFIPSHTEHPDDVARNKVPLSVDLVKHHIMNAI